jgi:histone deacetylase 1/2
MKQSKADPCLYYKHNNIGELEALMVVHVDDGAISGNDETRAQLKKAIAGQLSVKDEGKLKRHLGVSYEWNEDGSLTLHQNDYMQEIFEKYEEDFEVPRSFPTPGYPGVSLTKYEGELIRIAEYRSLVGKLLFATKRTYPEIANPVRELAGHMDCPGEEHWRAMRRLVGYLKYEATHGLVFLVPEDLTIIGYVDSDYASDKSTRKSTTGYLLTMGGCLVSWSSKAQPAVTLSSTEAEYVAASILGTEIKFLSMLLDELMIEYPKPPLMKEDNTGAIHIMYNEQVGQRTKHIDITWHHVRDMIRWEQLMVEYLRSGENPSDIMTKNTKEAIFQKHAPRIKNGVLTVVLGKREDVMIFEDTNTGLLEFRVL